MSSTSEQGAITGAADRALRVIQAEEHADHLIAQVRAGQLDAEALAIELAKAYGLGLQAMARSITKAIGQTPA